MAKEYGMWTSATARDDLRKLAEREGFGGFSDEEKYKLISVLTQLSMESPSDYQAVVDLVAKGWGPRAMPELVQEAEKRIKKYEDLRVMDYPERKAELTRLKLEDSRTYDAIREMANLSKNPSDKVIFSETTFKESEKAAKAQEAFEKKTPRQLAQEGKMKIGNVWTDKNGTRKWSYYPLTEADKKRGDAYWIEQNSKTCPELFAKAEKKTPRQLAQEGKMKIGNVWTDKNGTRKWSYYPLTEADKTKTEAYWIEQNRKKCPELFAKSAKQNENVSNSISLGNTAATNHSRISGNSGSAGGNMTLSANMDYALKMGPTVLKEELEGMGVTFPRDIIRHAKNGNEYIPTRLLKQWFQENQLSSEQISKLNALVDDRAAFNAKVKEINNRDEYVAAAPVVRQAESVQEEKPAEKDTKGKTEEKQRQDIEKENNEYAASLAGMKDEDLAKEKAELEAKAKEGDEAEKAKALQKMAIMEKEEQRREYEYQKESARKLYAENPKKFKKAKETYKNEAEKGTPRAQEFYDIMSEVEKEATASKMKKDKTKADTSAEAKSDDLQKTDKKSLKKAMKNRANDVSNFFKKTLGIKTKKDKEKETSQVVEQQQKAEQQLKAADNRKITLEHDKDGNAVYTLSGYGQFNGGEHNVLCDGKYTVHQSEQFSSVSFKSNNGNQFMEFAQGGRQLSLIQTLKDEITARSSEQAQQAALVAAQQKTNS